jgi:putative transposase/transposase-like zinc-binding protein
VGAEPDLGSIVRARSASFLGSHSTTAAQRKALRAIAACRTPALGGQRQQCDRCGFEHIVWHSCRSRCCPRCQGAARAEWVDQRRSELLPVPYFHVVFTVPEELNMIARRAPRAFYDLLFRAAGATLTDIAQSRLHVRIGALCVLHTWSQTLILHPHIHCVVPGGGFSLDGRRWMRVRKRTFFLPVRVLSRRFRTLVCRMLSETNLPELIDVIALRALLARVRAREWVVYAKPPFGGPAQVLAYLANYTHRIAISNRRIVAFDGQQVTFRYRHSSASNTHRLMTLGADEFLRRFLLHVVPSRFVRIRYYGFMANRTRASSLARARELIAQPVTLAERHERSKPQHCPRCSEGTLRLVGQIPRPNYTSYQDSS